MDPADGASGREWLADALRGLAIFGVLVVNAVGYAHFPDTLHVVPPPSPADSPWAWASQALLLTLLQAKAYPLLAFLFGWSFGRSSFGASRSGPRPGAAAADPNRRRRRRLGRLLLLGLLHGCLVYAGDILTAYALAGLLLLPTARWRLRSLRRLGIALLVASGVSLAFQAWTLHRLAALAEQDPSVLEGGSAYGQAASLWAHAGLSAPAYLWTQLLLTPVMLPSLMALMVAGLMVARLRGLSHRRWRPAWARGARWALPAGLLGNAALAWMTLASMASGLGGAAGAGIEPPPLAASVLQGLVGPLLSFGAVAWLASRRPAWLQGWAAAGRRSLSLYLAGSLVFLLVFGGAGLGLGARLGSVATLGTALLLATAMLVLATASVRRGRVGLAERWLSS